MAQLVVGERSWLLDRRRNLVLNDEVPGVLARSGSASSPTGRSALLASSCSTRLRSDGLSRHSNKKRKAEGAKSRQGRAAAVLEKQTIVYPHLKISRYTYIDQTTKASAMGGFPCLCFFPRPFHLASGESPCLPACADALGPTQALL